MQHNGVCNGVGLICSKVFVKVVIECREWRGRDRGELKSERGGRREKKRAFFGLKEQRGESWNGEVRQVASDRWMQVERDNWQMCGDCDEG